MEKVYIAHIGNNPNFDFCSFSGGTPMRTIEKAFKSKDIAREWLENKMIELYCPTSSSVSFKAFDKHFFDLQTYNLYGGFLTMLYALSDVDLDDGSDGEESFKETKLPIGYYDRYLIEDIKTLDFYIAELEVH